jgi:hypothetical protein
MLFERLYEVGGVMNKIPVSRYEQFRSMLASDEESYQHLRNLILARGNKVGYF